MLKKYFEKIIAKISTTNHSKYPKPKDEIKSYLEYYRKNKRIRYSVRKKGLSNLYPTMFEEQLDILCALHDIYSRQAATHKDVKYKIIVFIIKKFFIRNLCRIQKLWMWRNNLEPFDLHYRLEGCEETIDEDGNPCLFHRTPPRTGKLKRIWNKLTFGVNDD